MSKVSQKLQSARFPFRDVTISLDRESGARRDELLRTRQPIANKLESLVEGKAGDTRLGAGGPSADLRRIDAEIAELEAKMRDAAITLRITGVSFGKYNEYIAANPAREGKPEQFNYSTFYIYTARRTAMSVEDDGSLEVITDDEWDRIEAALTDGEHDRIATAVVAVNRTEGLRGVDFLSSVSEKAPASSESSAQPAPSA